MPDQPSSRFTREQDDIFKAPTEQTPPARQVLTVSQLNRQAPQ